MKTLENASDEDLLNELEKRKKARTATPSPSPEPDIQMLRRVAAKLVADVKSNGKPETKDYQEACFESLLTAFYGDNIFEWWNQNYKH